MIDYDNPEGLVAWAEDRIGMGPFSHDAHPIGWRRDGRLVAVAVFHLFDGGFGCEVSLAVSERRWFSRGFIAATCAYPFIQLRLERVTCHVGVSDLPARALARAIGFQFEGRKRRLDPTTDRLMYGLLRTECKWLKPMTLAA